MGGALPPDEIPAIRREISRLGDVGIVGAPSPGMNNNRLLLLALVLSGSAIGAGIYFGHRNALPTTPPVTQPTSRLGSITDAGAEDVPVVDAATSVATVVVIHTVPTMRGERVVRRPIARQVDEQRAREETEAALRRNHADIAAQQQSRVRAESRERPNDPQLQSLVPSAMRNAIASRDRSSIASLRRDITWLAEMPEAFRNRDAVAETATLFPEWIAAHDEDTRPSDSWIQSIAQNLR